MEAIFNILMRWFALYPISHYDRKDLVIWPILKIFWEPFSKKRSHWRHWRDHAGIMLTSFIIPRDHAAKQRALATFTPSNIWNTNFAWSTIAVMKPAYRKKGRFQIGFMAQEGEIQKCQLCTIIFEKDEVVACLVGAYDNSFFAVEYPSGAPLALELIKVMDKSELTADTPLI